MEWNVAHQRGMGFPLVVLRPVGVYSVLSNLYEYMHLRPKDLRCMLVAANRQDESLMGRRDLSGGISHTLNDLSDAGLIVCCVGGARGIHTRYDLTRLGAGLIGSLGPVTEWAMADFEFVVGATRIRLGLPPLDKPPPPELRQPRTATGMAINLLDGRWTPTVMAYVDSAGCKGIGPLRLERAVNAAIEASSGESRVVRRLQRAPLHAALHRLVDTGLLLRREDPPQVRYLLSGHGRGLMDAWWRVADGWGISHDEELFRIMQRTSGWYAKPSGG